MVEAVKKLEDKLLCRYCQIDLDPVADKLNGFIKCPGCERSYLKLSKKALPKSEFKISLSAKKVLDLFVSPADKLAELERLQNQLSVQESQLNELKVQRESFLDSTEKLDGLDPEEKSFLSGQIETLKEKNVELEARLEAVQNEVVHQESLVEGRNKELVELKDLLEKSRQGLADKEALLLALNKEETFKTLTLVNVQNDYLEAKQLLEKQDEEIKVFEMTIEKLSEEIVVLRESLKIVPDLEMEIEEAKFKSTELQEIIDRSLYTKVSDEGMQHVELLNTEIIALKNDISEYVKTIQVLEERVSAFEKSDVNERNNAKLDASIQSISALKDDSDKVDSLETELVLTRDELEKAKNEISGLNQMLEKAFYENQKNQNGDSQNSPVVTVGDGRVNTQLEAIKEQFSSVSVLSQNLYLTRINAEGEQKRIVLFEKGLVLPKDGLELKKEISYVVNRNKGIFLFESAELLSLFHVDFSSNLNFFIKESEYQKLDKRDVQVSIREEYILKNDGSLEIVFYRNNGFKRFEQMIGKIENKVYELNLQ